MPETRCAAHPGRPAVDACPVCDRPRCGADAQAAPGEGCAVCEGGPARVPLRRPPGDLELLVRATLAGDAAAIALGYVSAEYVQSGLLAYLSSFALGVLVGGAASAAARHPRGVLGARVRGLALLLAVLGVGLGFVLEGTYGVLDLRLDVLLSYLLAVAGCWLWTAPPKRVRAASGA
ncbi:MAG: hypothetical protein WCD35_19470 [Mycobacteriales bacterium]